NLRKLRLNDPPRPVETSALEIMGGQHDMKLVRLPGQVLEVTQRKQPTVVFRLIAQNITFTAEYHGKDFPKEWRRVLPQSTVSLTGVCAIDGGKSGFVRQF